MFLQGDAMATITQASTIQTLTTHYIDGAFVESHGREVMDIILRPTVNLSRKSTWATKKTRGAQSPRPSAPLPLTAHRNRRSVRKFCAGCTAPLRFGLTT